MAQRNALVQLIGNTPFDVQRCTGGKVIVLHQYVAMITVRLVVKLEAIIAKTREKIKEATAHVHVIITRR
ncbi:hypothetical protein AC249_AIPGENE16744 [Exaiptasia diaphana]|nr:hypothetical protein AC249_AIPGENE16744 [Exaiptasia diaphana]